MANNNIKLIVSDMDGTLLHTNKDITEYNLATINKLSDHDIMFALGTGRNISDLSYFLPLFSKVKLNLIALNGGFVQNYDHIAIQETRFKVDDVINLVKILQKYPVYIELQNVYNIYATLPDLRLKWLKCFPVFAGYSDEKIMQLEAFKKTNFIEFTKEFFTLNPIYKIVVGNIQNIDLQEIVKELNLSVQSEISSSSAKNLEINPYGVDKGKGIKILCDYYNLSLDQVVAIGDNLNDLSMLQTAGKFYAMENSHELLLQQATHKTASNQQDGVAKAIIDALGMN